LLRACDLWCTHCKQWKFGFEIISLADIHYYYYYCYIDGLEKVHDKGIGTTWNKGQKGWYIRTLEEGRLTWWERRVADYSVQQERVAGRQGDWRWVSNAHEQILLLLPSLPCAAHHHHAFISLCLTPSHFFLYNHDNNEEEEGALSTRIIYTFDHRSTTTTSAAAGERRVDEGWFWRKWM